MDKIRRSARAFIAIISLNLATQAQAFQSIELPWFQLHPHPTLEEMTRSELLRSLEYVDGREDYCVANLQIEFQIYIDRYPQVLNHFRQGEAIERWRQHVLSRPELDMEFCVIDQLTDEIEASAKQIPSLGVDLFYCNGLPSREPLTQHERELFALMERMESYAESGSPSAVRFLSETDGVREWMINDLEFQYFYILTADPGFPETNEQINYLQDYRVEYIAEGLRSIIEESAKARDFNAISQLLDGCTQEKIDWQKFNYLDGPPADPPPPVQIPDAIPINR